MRKYSMEESLYDLLMFANDKEYVESLSTINRERLKRIIKQDYSGKDCVCCPCFAWKYDENRKINGCICTIGGKANKDGAGDCRLIGE